MIRSLLLSLKPASTFGQPGQTTQLMNPRKKTSRLFSLPLGLSLLLLYTLLIGQATAADNTPATHRLTQYSLYQHSDIIGSLRTVNASEEDSLIDIAERYGIGYEAIRAANPFVDAWLPGEGTTVVLPNQHLLPNTLKEGIVVNVAEMRLYYYPPEPVSGSRSVEVYAISIGRGDWSTPLVETAVVSKIEDPVWFPPQSIRDEHAAKGKFLPLRVPAGPNNPLGKYVIQLDIPGYFIHGTDKRFGIGMQVTHGCLRMYAQDIEHLTFAVANGTKVAIINQRFKAGWKNDGLYLEVHPALDSDRNASQEQQELASEQLATAMTKALIEATANKPDYRVNWDKVEQIHQEARGIPTYIGINAELAEASIASLSGQAKGEVLGKGRSSKDSSPRD